VNCEQWKVKNEKTVCDADITHAKTLFDFLVR